jgi:hypothetical protein
VKKLADLLLCLVLHHSRRVEKQHPHAVGRRQCRSPPPTP